MPHILFTTIILSQSHKYIDLHLHKYILHPILQMDFKYLKLKFAFYIFFCDQIYKTFLKNITVKLTLYKGLKTCSVGDTVILHRQVANRYF